MEWYSYMFFNGFLLDIYIHIRLGDVYICWVLVSHNQFAVHINSKPKESYKLTMILLFLNKDIRSTQGFEGRENHRIRGYLLIIQHKSLTIVCSPKTTFLVELKWDLVFKTLN